MPAMPEPGTSLGGHRIVRQLGVGPGGASFEATVESTGQTVVLKALAEKEPLTAAQRDGITAEFRALAGLRSDRIVTPRAAGEADGLFWLIYPFEQGGSLAEHLAGGGPLQRSDAIDVCIDLAIALGQAHVAGITHGGVKPTNVFVTGRAGARAQLSDFGARLRAVDWEGTPEARLAQSGYAAPETLSSGVRDVRADVYSLGCVLYAMLTGNSPAEAAEVLGGIVQVPENDAVDRDLNGLLKLMLHPDPRQRIADMPAVQDALATLGRTPVAAAAPVVPAAAPEEETTHGANPLHVAAAAMDGTLPVQDNRSRRRLGAGAFRIGVAVIGAAIGAAIVLGLLAWWLHRDNGSSKTPVADPTPTIADTPSGSPSTTPAAATVKVDARPAYRAVTFTVSSGGQATEYQQQGQWKKVSGGKINVPTSQGSEKACVKVRLASSGSPVSTCGESLAPELVMEPVGACTIGTTPYTHCYELTLAGFRPGPTKVQSAAKDSHGVLQHYTDNVTIDNSGHGRDQARFGTSSPATVQITVGDVVKNLSIG